MTGDPRDDRIRDLEDALRDVAREAASARAALCENELVIRLDNILARSLEALKERGGGTGV